MKKRVLISAPYFIPVVDQFRGFFEENGIDPVLAPVEERLEESQLLDLIADIDGVVCGDDRFTERVLRSANRLKVISKWGTGIDSIDRVAAEKLGIQVRNTPNAFTEPVADSAMGYILCFARKLPWMAEDLKRGAWGKIPSVALNECTLGIFGMGNIGKAIAKRAQAFGMRVLGNDPLGCTMVEMVSKERLLKESDFVSINCDLNPTSHYLVQSADLAQMKKTAVLLNLARGPIVKEKDLIAALERGQIAGAALDVFEEEPLPVSSPLRKMTQVMCASHNSNSSPKAWAHVHQNTLNNLKEGLAAR